MFKSAQTIKKNKEYGILNDAVKNVGKLKISSFTDLNAWKEAHGLALEVYKATRKFPREETYSLTDQMRRASVSIVSNIAEGFTRDSYKDKVQFYFISKGSTAELQIQLLLARDLNYLPNLTFKTISEKTITTHKLLTRLIKGTRQKIGGTK